MNLRKRQNHRVSSHYLGWTTTPYPVAAKPFLLTSPFIERDFWETGDYAMIRKRTESGVVTEREAKCRDLEGQGRVAGSRRTLRLGAKTITGGAGLSVAILERIGRETQLLLHILILLPVITRLH
jgi:hypothetical protein